MHVAASVFQFARLHLVATVKVLTFSELAGIQTSSAKTGQRRMRNVANLSVGGVFDTMSLSCISPSQSQRVCVFFM